MAMLVAVLAAAGVQLATVRSGRRRADRLLRREPDR